MAKTTLTKSELFSLDFTVNRYFLMKLFKTNNTDVVKSCQSFFDFSLPSHLWAGCNKKLNVTYMTCDKNFFVHYGN